MTRSCEWDLSSSSDEGQSLDERKTAALAPTNRAARIQGQPDGSVLINGFSLASQLLRRGGTRQAGFNAAMVERFPQKNLSVLFKEGDEHRLQRSAVARFFAPRVVTERYRRLMTDLSARLVAGFKAKRRAKLDDMSLTLSVAVAAEIVGVTESLVPGMGWRLNGFFALEAPKAGAWFSTAVYIVRAQLNLLAVYLLDVRPAIRARRRAPREDLISHLIGQKWSDLDILTECVTYATAGMSTTREFIIVAAWHLLERDDLRHRFLDADKLGRNLILEEILRLEPPVGTLLRRTNVAVTLDDDGRETEIPADTLVAIDIRGVNSDARAAGVCPHRLDPDRGTRGPANHMSFGDGAHKCPGASVALQETSIFLDHLLRVPGIKLATEPTLSWNTMTMGYVLRDAVLTAG
jgi:cytochrome P450